MTTVKTKKKKEAVTAQKTENKIDLTKLTETQKRFFEAFKSANARARANKEIKKEIAGTEKTRQVLRELETQYNIDLAEAKKCDESPEKSKSTLSAKGKKVKRVIDSGFFGCNSSAVADLCSEILEEKITYKNESASKVERVDNEYIDNRMNILHNSSGCIESSVFPMGTIIVFEEYDDYSETDKGTYVIMPDYYSGYGTLIDIKGNNRQCEYINILSAHIADDEEIFEFIKKSKKSVLDENKFLFV